MKSPVGGDMERWEVNSCAGGRRRWDVGTISENEEGIFVFCGEEG